MRRAAQNKSRVNGPPIRALPPPRNDEGRFPPQEPTDVTKGTPRADHSTDPTDNGATTDSPTVTVPTGRDGAGAQFMHWVKSRHRISRALDRLDGTDDRREQARQRLRRDDVATLLRTLDPELWTLLRLLLEESESTCDEDYWRAIGMTLGLIERAAAGQAMREAG
jgi:hypothetical protein